ncbi:MAG: class I SAM-dependent RNA methyltransferase [Candidatus Gracilibacteria bacterium]|nr:class I SAM-dependent RNA methyltransferase [Candidatus Gracilibacteria bacterium]
MQKNIKILRKIPQEKKLPYPAINRESFQFFITCQAGVEALVKREAEKIGLKNFDVQDRIVRGEGTEKNLYELLVQSRFSNRVYIELASAITNDFDSLFELVKNISWKNFLRAGIAIVAEATAIKSTLSHTPSIQSIAKKAIVSHLTDGTGTHHLYENRDGDEAHIQIFMIENRVHILIDITGNPLHKRGYRTESGDAPIKENLAAAILAISGWRFRKKFLDPFCGSGTFAIEAAMLARNIAPGLGRHFAVENFPFFEKEIFYAVRREAREKIYPSGNYQIFASDIDPKMIEIAKNNARRAGVEDDIIFVEQNFFDYDFGEKTTIVTNPPYGERIEANEEISNFYEKFVKFFENQNISGGFITSYSEAEKWLPRAKWKNRKLYNGGLPARWYQKIK